MKLVPGTAESIAIYPAFERHLKLSEVSVILILQEQSAA
jgi:hypothetical protein